MLMTKGFPGVVCGSGGGCGFICRCSHELRVPKSLGGMAEDARAARTWLKIVWMARSAGEVSCGVWGIVVWRVMC